MARPGNKIIQAKLVGMSHLVAKFYVSFFPHIIHFIESVLGPPPFNIILQDQLTNKILLLKFDKIFNVIADHGIYWYASFIEHQSHY